MKCPHCGAQVGLEDKYCPFCGLPNEFAQKHQEDMAKDSRFKGFQVLKSAPAGAVYMKKPEKDPR